MFPKFRQLLIYVFALLLAFGCSVEKTQRRSESTLSIEDIFFLQNDIWDGEYDAYVNKDKGIVQRGRIIVKMRLDEKNVIHQSNAFMRPDGSQTEYQGVAELKLEGSRLIWVGDSSKDPSTGNRLENHRFSGFVKREQAYIQEDYDEIFPDGRREHRHNDVHYLVISENEVLMMGNVSVDRKPLVFSSTRLLKRSVEN